MLEHFRKAGATLTSRILLGFLALAFVVWGIGEYVRPSVSAAAVLVNGEDVGVVRLEETYKQQLAVVEQALGQKPNEAELAQLQLAERIVGEAIGRTVLRQTAANLGLVSAVKQLQDLIADNELFRGENGGFDAVRYKGMLARIGKSPEQFEAEMGRDLSVQLLGQTVRVAGVTDTVVAPLAALQSAKVSLEVAEIVPAAVESAGQPTADELKRYFELNEQVYRTPEKRDVAILELSRMAVSGTITVGEEQIVEAYEANKAAYVLPEKRVVRHILLPSMEKARAAAAEIKNKQDFMAAADRLSTDPGNVRSGKKQGGLLGPIARTDVVKAFGDAAFGLPVNEMSKPVQTPFGVHLIWVDAVEPGREQTLADVREDIKQQLVAQENEDVLVRLLEQVDEKVAAGEDLAKIAKDVGMKLEYAKQLTVDDPRLPPALLDMAFATGEGQIGAPIGLSDGGNSYVMVEKVEGSVLPKLGEIREQVVADWQAASVEMAAQRDADKVLAAVRAPTPRSMADAVAQAGAKKVKLANVEFAKLEDVPEWLQPRLLDVYPLPEGATLPVAVRAEDGWRVVRVTKRTLAQPDAKELALTAGAYRAQLQADMEGLVVAQLQRESRIECNQPRLRQIFGREVRCE